MKKRKCKVCKKTIRYSGAGRPRTVHERCKSKLKKKTPKKKTTKKKTKKKTTKKKTKKKAKKSKTTRRGRSVTRSRQGREITGPSGWLALWHGGKSGKTQHDKTWSIKVEKKGSRYRVLTRWGRRTGQKNVTRHPWTTEDKALRKANSLLDSKLRKGYMIVGANRKKKRRTRKRRNPRQRKNGCRRRKKTRK